MSKHVRSSIENRKTARFRQLGGWLRQTLLILIYVLSLAGMNPTSVSAAGTTYYVDETASCSDSGPGTEGVPYCTLAKGASMATLPGDIVHVLNGTYPETIFPVYSGEDGSPITFLADPGVTVTGNNSSAFVIGGQNHIVIEGFTITETQGKGISVIDSDHITISNNHVSYAGIDMGPDMHQQGIYLKNTTDSTVTGNITDHNSCIGIRLTNGSDNNTVSDNISFANASYIAYETVVVSDAAGIELTGSSNNTVINNITYGNEDSGINMYVSSSAVPSSYNLVIGNLSYGNGDHGIDNNDSPYNTIIGNTVQGNGTTGINFEGSTTGSHHATVINNITVSNGFTPPSGSFGGNLRVDSSSVTGTTLDYNIYNIDDASVQIIWDNTNYTSLAAFHTPEPSQEVHGLEGDPLFVDPVDPVLRSDGVQFNGNTTTGNYHLTTGSPAIDNANSDAPSQPDHDIEGNPRVDDPLTTNNGAGTRDYDDRGAYEFQITGIYTVTFDANGGSGTMSDQTGVYDTTAALTSNAYTRTGYTFSNWNTEALGTGTSYANEADYHFIADITLYAQWTLDSGYFTVTFDANGGTGTMSDQANNVPTALTANAFTLTGYTFDGWDTDPEGGGTHYDDEATYIFDADITLYAQWMINSYTVTFNANGGTGTMSDQTGDYNTTAALTANAFTLTDYIFAGWDTLPGGGGIHYDDGADYTFIANVTLYAQWLLDSFTVTYDGNGSDSGSPPVDGSSPYTFGATVTVLANIDLAKTGYTFAGWNTQADGLGTDYASGASFSMPAANVILYAKWTINSYTLTYDGNTSDSGTPPVDGSSPYDFGATVTVLDNTDLAKTGYIFDGWNTQADGLGTDYVASDTFPMPAANVTLYAQWIPDSFTVTYDGNTSDSGTPPVDSSSPYAFGATVTVLANTDLAKINFTFGGWNTQADGLGTDYVASDTFPMPAANVTLYAKWVADTYTVTYDGNGSDSGSAPVDGSSPYAVGATVTVLANTDLARTGYTFVGWNTQADGLGTDYVASNTFPMPAANVTLYAKWTINSYTVTYNGNGSDSGTAPIDGSSPYAFGTTVTVLANTDLAKTDFTFGGWNTQADGLGTDYAPSNSFPMPAENVTLYAKWIADTYTVTYDGNGSDSGTPPVDSSSPYVVGATVTVLANTDLAKTNFTFVGWNTQDTMAFSSVSTLPMPNSVVSVTFFFPRKSPKISEALGLVVDGSSPYVVGATVTVLANTDLAKTDFTFGGWNTQADGLGTDYAPSDTFPMPAANVTLYAKWTINSYTVTYDGNGNDSGTAPVDGSSPYAVGATVTVLANTDLAKTDFTFGGWNTQADGLGTDYVASDTFPMPAANVTLYAKWIADTYTVTYDGNGNDSGTAPVDGSSPYAVGATVTVLDNTDLAKTNYVFAGWNTQADGLGTDYAPSDTFSMPAANVTLYAKWAHKIYTLTLKSQPKYDGWVLESGEFTSMGGTKNNLGKILLLGDNIADKQYRDILSFGTAAIPDNAVITSVVLKVKKAGVVGTNPMTTHNGLVVDVRKGKFYTLPALQINDFQAKAGKYKIGKFPNKLYPGNWYRSVLYKGAYNYGYINKLGRTQFRLRFLLGDNDNNAADILKLYSGDAYLANRPKLIVRYYIP